MNQKKISSAQCAQIEAEIPNLEVAKDKNCDKCESRFKCWTHRGMALKVEKFSLSADGYSPDRIVFMAYVPKCFRYSNLVGSDVFIHIRIAEQEQHFKSIIMRQEMRAEGNNPMELEIEAVERCSL